MEKIVTMGLLFDLYGSFLTKNQVEIVDLYYNHDYSLKEISEHFGISRQGVHDTLKKAQTTLLNMEEKLKLFSRKEALKKDFNEICTLLQQLRATHLTPDQMRYYHLIQEKVQGLEQTML